METKWSQSETRNGIPYYINHDSEVTQWDHPDLVSAISGLSAMDTIQFGAYRTAAKLRKLQKILHMDVVNLITVRMAFELHGFSHHNDSVMDAVQLYNIIYEMYHMTKLRGRTTLHVNRCSDLMLNWLLNLYDVQRTGCIRVLPVKVGVATICAGRITEKYRYFQDLLADRSGRISRKMMTEFMHDVTQITDMLGESSTFGKGVTASVEDCFQSALGPSIIQDDFYQWLLQEPQTLIWLPTLHRFSAAETMKHEVKCVTCKMHPIIGLRYQCLKCFNYDLCQHCFFTRRTSKHHKQSHPMQEYCLSSKTKEDVRAFTKTVRNRLSKKHGRRIKKKYRTIEDGWERDDDRDSDNQDAQIETHVRLSQMSERLKAVEAELPAGLNQPHSLRDTSSLPASVKSTRPSIATATTDESRYLERRELEDLIEALERENDDLIDDLERVGLPLQDSTDSQSASDTESDSEPRQQRRPGPHEQTALREQRNEVFARYEVLEEHNRRLEGQLRQLKGVVNRNQNQERAGRKRDSRESAGPGFKSHSEYPSSSIHTQSHQQPDLIHQLSNQSSGYQASSGYERRGERLPPYGQSHPALDTIDDDSSGSSQGGAHRPRFIMMGNDYADAPIPNTMGNATLRNGGVSQQGIANGVGPQRLQTQLRMADLMSNVQTGLTGTSTMHPPHHINPPAALQSHLLDPITGVPHFQHGHGDGAHRFKPDISTQPYVNAGTSHITAANINHAGSFRADRSQLPGLQIEESHLTGLPTDQSHQSRYLPVSQSYSSEIHFNKQHHPTGFQFDQSRPAGIRIDQSRALESVLDLDGFLPHLGEQSTVHFPTMAASMAYPSEEAELDEMIQRMTDAFPLHDDDSSPSPPPEEPELPVQTMEEFLEPKPRRPRGARRGSGDLFSAANRIGDAMSSLVTRVSIGGVQR